jgi:hypothetical protein
VARPKGCALARVTALLRGTGGRDLAGQRAAAEAAGRQLREAETQLLLAQRQYEQVTAALAALAPAVDDATAVLAQRQRQLSDAGGWVAERLRQLEGEHQRLTSQLREAERAQQAAAYAREALARACDQLSPTPRWPTYGGPFGALFEVSRLDKAVTAAAEADRYLSRVPAQLAEADIGGPLAPRMGKDHSARLRDIMLDSHTVLLAARLGIEDARPQVEHTIAQVDDLRARLEQQVAWRRTRLAEIDQARLNLLTQR